MVHVLLFGVMKSNKLSCVLKLLRDENSEEVKTCELDGNMLVCRITNAASSMKRGSERDSNQCFLLIRGF